MNSQSSSNVYTIVFPDGRTFPVLLSGIREVTVHRMNFEPMTRLYHYFSSGKINTIHVYFDPVIPSEYVRYISIVNERVTLLCTTETVRIHHSEIAESLMTAIRDRRYRDPDQFSMEYSGDPRSDEE